MLGCLGTLCLFFAVGGVITAVMPDVPFVYRVGAVIEALITATIGLIALQVSSLSHKTDTKPSPEVAYRSRRTLGKPILDDSSNHDKK